MTKQRKIHKSRFSTPPWHILEPWQTSAWLKVDHEKGLNGEEAQKRLTDFGPNAIREERGRGAIRMFFGQFADFMIIVLIMAGIVSGLIGDLTDTITIVVIVVLNALIGFVQEFRAERAVAALKRLTSPTALVLREGKTQTIAAQELVPGDLHARGRQYRTGRSQAAGRGAAQDGRGRIDRRIPASRKIVGVDTGIGFSAR